MIDYDKLKIAHELAEKIKYDSWRIEISYGNPSYADYLLLMFQDENGMHNECEYDLEEIDDFIAAIAKLTELTKSELTLIEIIPRENGSCLLDAGVYRLIDGKWYREKEEEYCDVSGAKLGKESQPEINPLFMDGEQKSPDQIKSFFASECRHEPEGNRFHFTDEGGTIVAFKCKRCGILYRP